MRCSTLKHIALANVFLRPHLRCNSPKPNIARLLHAKQFSNGNVSASPKRTLIRSIGVVGILQARKLPLQHPSRKQNRKHGLWSTLHGKRKTDGTGTNKRQKNSHWDYQCNRSLTKGNQRLSTCAAVRCSTGKTRAFAKIGDSNNQKTRTGEYSARDLKKMYNAPETVRRIQQVLHCAQHLEYKKILMEPPITPRHKQERINWARESLRSSDRVWQRTIWPDKKKFNIDGPDDCAIYWADTRLPRRYF